MLAIQEFRRSPGHALAARGLLLLYCTVLVAIFRFQKRARSVALLVCLSFIAESSRINTLDIRVYGSMGVWVRPVEGPYGPSTGPTRRLRDRTKRTLYGLTGYGEVLRSGLRCLYANCEQQLLTSGNFENLFTHHHPAHT